jgi:hypothetical protein
MTVVAWVAGGIALYLWIATSLTTTDRRVWPFAPCRRCCGKGRWRMADRSDFTARRQKHVYCSACRATGVRIGRR